jgi:putative endonuclease
MKTLWRGRQQENRALTYLQEQGLTHRESNFHSRHGEIDLIMQDGQTLVFVEVRYRRNKQFGGAAASIDRKKIGKIIKTGLSYLQQKKLDTACRFDVVAINGDDDINWIKRAFEMEY